ncbi:MAG: fluoride efflux transporter CrcB [Rhodospirillales bacterium]
MLLAVAAGGALGAVGRYLAAGWAARAFGGAWAGFPFGTLTVNVIGSVVLGALIELMALKWSPSPEARAFLVVGVLGAFTTFSTFSMDVVLLITRHQIFTAGAYILASVAVCVLGFWVGMAALRHVLA